MGAIANLGRLLDSAVLAMFTVILAGAALYCMGLVHHMVVITERNKLGAFGNLVANALPFKGNRFEFNLTHVLLYAILCVLLSLSHHKYLDAQSKRLEKEEKKQKGKKSE
mmetsp:Transcript_1947/g.2100  ORF Transcript_1947/g.2100 Transcript_1947/m.2100 type:complete len:110 (+) Transcript_1947:18-347(+)